MGYGQVIAVEAWTRSFLLDSAVGSSTWLHSGAFGLCFGSLVLVAVAGVLATMLAVQRKAVTSSLLKASNHIGWIIRWRPPRWQYHHDHGPDVFATSSAQQWVLLLGLDNSGKSSLCQLLDGRRCWPSRHPRPQHHVLHHEVSLLHENRKINLVDPCGEFPHCKKLWGELLYSRPDAIVFVVDAADVQRLGEVHSALHWVLRHPAVQGLPVLVLGNKVDLPSALETWQLKQRLGLAGLSHEQRETFLATSSHSASLPSELRRRIASFHPDEAGSEPHKGILNVEMCSLARCGSSQAVRRWLLSNTSSSAGSLPGHRGAVDIGRLLGWHGLGRRLACSFSSACECLRRSSSVSRQAFLLPLHHA